MTDDSGNVVGIDAEIAAAIAENTLEVRFANNFDGVATAWISVAFIP